MDHFALVAWTARIMLRALESPPAAKYKPGSITQQTMREIARLSWSEHGPRLAQEFLRKRGVALVIEPHLPRTHLDGAAVLVSGERPVIGLTLRHDRLDNFWFTLMHECAHLSLHLTPEFIVNEEAPEQFIDDLDAGTGGDTREEEADHAAGDALVPEDVWRVSPASMLRSASAVRALAEELNVHPAIVAGRIRRQYNDYRVLGDLVGRGTVRRLFPEVVWPEHIVE
jgi:HTH-type transcriptional regulator/antitoxin HigA